MSKGYGLPYMGSKNKIAEWVISNIESGEVLYDLFAGGCALTHAALESNKWKRIVCNDITDAPKLFYDAINGKYKDCDRWVSREEFFAEKDNDPFVRILWSFGNNQREYLYSRELEPYKKALHEMIFAKTPTERRLKYRNVIRQMGTLPGEKKYSQCSLESLERLESLQSLESLERLQSLESLERLQSLESLEICQKSYDEIEIDPNGIIICDPPYKGTVKYIGDFDHEKFYEWIKRQNVPVYICEYDMPSDFTLLAEIKKMSTLSATNNAKRTMERIYGWNVEPKRKDTQLKLKL